MSARADQAMRAWVNARPGLTGPGNPLAAGAFLRSQRSPASGAYAVLAAGPSLRAGLAAEDGSVSTHRLTFLVHAGTQEASEDAVTALANAVRTLRGNPEPCGDTGVMVLVHDNMTEPADVPMPASGGELYAYMISADFVLYQPPD